MGQSMFIIYYPDTTGGTATLTIRLGKQLIKHGYRVILICNRITDKNNEILMGEIGIEVYCWDYKEAYNNFLKMSNDQIHYIFLTYRLDDYLLIEKIKSKFKMAESILYIVHFHGLIKAINQNVITRLFAKKFYLPIIKKILNNNSVIFMDDNSITETEKYYNINIKRRKNLIFHLPMDITKLETSIVRNKINLDILNILTIARAEFPFKGYIIGLIDDFNELCRTYNNITLTIIAFGPDESQIKEKVKQLPAPIQNKIKLVGHTPYDELCKYFNQAHLFLGMGTTILDAANHGVPSIAVQPYTYENNSSGFFHEQPEFLGGYEDKSIPAINYMKKVIEMLNEEYLELCQMEYRALEENYNISTLANYLINIEEDINPKTISDFELKLHKLMFKINKTRRTLIHKLKYKNRS